MSKLKKKKRTEHALLNVNEFKLSGDKSGERLQGKIVNGYKHIFYIRIGLKKLDKEYIRIILASSV